MSDAPFDEGGDGWEAMPASATPADSQPMQMQMQSQSVDDAFGNEEFPVSAPVTIMTASGQAQNLDDDLTEEEKEIVQKAAEYQDELKQQIHNRMMEEARAKNERKTAGHAAVNQWQEERQGQINLRKQNNDSME